MGRRPSICIAVVAFVLAPLAPPLMAQTSDEVQIAYVLGGSIYTIDAAGGSPTRLTYSIGDADPTWSPDGSKIAFVGPARTSSGTGLELHTMNADGSGLTQLTTSSGDEHDPTWSPDGARIGFSRTDVTDEDIYVIGTDGAGEQTLTSNDFDDVNPVFSPDSTRIAFASARDRVTACRRNETDCVPAPEIYTMNADGSSSTRVTVDIDDDEQGCCGSPDYEPTWSPDGTRIAFERRRSDARGDPYIALMNNNGTQQEGLISRRKGAAEPSWLPNGKLIAFTQGDEDPMVAVSTLGGGCVRLLTPGSSPAWQPGGSGAPEQFCPAPTIAYDGGKELFSGRVDATGAHYERSRGKNRSVCEEDQTLRLLKRVTGPNQQVATGVTDENGFWSIPWPTSRQGDFYVKLEAKKATTAEGDLVFCAASRSVALPVPPIAASYLGPPPVTFRSPGARQRAARGTYSWCRAFNYYLGSCLHADTFGHAFPERAEPVTPGTEGRITFHRDERPKLRYLHYWRSVGEFGQPEGQGRRISLVLHRRQGERFHVWVAVFRIPRGPGDMFINFSASWAGSRGTGSGGGYFDLHLYVR